MQQTSNIKSNRLFAGKVLCILTNSCSFTMQELKLQMPSYFICHRNQFYMKFSYTFKYMCMTIRKSIPKENKVPHLFFRTLVAI